MTDEELIRTIEKCVRNGNCFTTEVKNISVNCKNAGGPKENAQKLLEQLAIGFSDNELMQERTYNILDIVTGCVILK